MKTSDREVRPASTDAAPLPRPVKVAEGIIESLRRDIITRRRADGERLPSEKELSDRFGASQTTVREAIRALEALGLVEVVHGTGSFVRSQGDFALASALQTFLQLKSVGIMEALSIRQVLGRHAIELAAANATKQDVAAIAAICARFEQARDMKESTDVIAHIIGFQHAVSAASHSPLLQSLEAFLLALLHEVQATSLIGRGVRFWRARALEFQPHRIAILEGIRSGDPLVARRAMDGYFDAQRSRFEKVKDLRELNLSDPRLIAVVASTVRQFRT